MTAAATLQRFTATDPCPVCGGYDRMPRGQGERCFGFRSGDYARCTREEHAGGLDLNDDGTYSHFLIGPCRCGGTHGDPPPPRAVAANGHASHLVAPSRIVATYAYERVKGRTVYEVLRRDPKSFTQRQPDGKGGWLYHLSGVARVVFRHPEVEAADRSRLLLWVEGEKDVLAAERGGLLATTTSQGSKSLKTYDEAYLREVARDRPIAIVADPDKDGERYAADVARIVGPVAASVTVVRLDGLDLADWLACGHSADDLRALVDATPPLEKVSDGTTTLTASERKVVFHTARELAAATPSQPEAIVVGLLFVAALTELVGKIKAAGKTTFMLAWVAAILKRRTFLGLQTTYTPVILLTEQGRTSFRQALRRAGLLERDDLHVMFWHDVIGMPWPAVVAAATAKAKEIGARLLIVDTLAQFAGLKGDSENDAGAALEAVQPLQVASAVHGLAVAMLRHERKSGGEVGDSGRGSSAYAGAVDVVLQLRRGDGNTPENVRILSSLSRFDETPNELVIELTEDGYVARGTETAVRAEDARQKILDASPKSEGDALAESDLIDAAKVARTTGREAIKQHVEDGRLARLGTGKRGDPYRYWRPEKVSDGTPVVPSERNELAATQVRLAGDEAAGAVCVECVAVLPAGWHSRYCERHGGAADESDAGEWEEVAV